MEQNLQPGPARVSVGSGTALQRLAILYTPVERRFERIIRLAQALLQSDIVGLSFVTEDCEWQKSSFGPIPKETPINDSLANLLLLSDETTLNIADTQEHLAARHSRLVTRSPNIASYSAHAILAPDGSKVGAFYAAETSQQQFSAEHMQYLQDFADLAQNELQMGMLYRESHRFVAQHDAQTRRGMLDATTHLWCSEAVGQLIQRRAQRCLETGVPCGVLLINISNAASIDADTFNFAGHNAWSEMAHRILSALRAQDSLGRFQETGFVAFVNACNAKQLTALANRVHSALTHKSLFNGVWVTAEIGAASATQATATAADIMRTAESAFRIANERSLPVHTEFAD